MRAGTPPTPIASPSLPGARKVASPCDVREEEVYVNVDPRLVLSSDYATCLRDLLGRGGVAVEVPHIAVQAWDLLATYASLASNPQRLSVAPMLGAAAYVAAQLSLARLERLRLVAPGWAAVALLALAAIPPPELPLDACVEVNVDGEYVAYSVTGTACWRVNVEAATRTAVLRFEGRLGGVSLWVEVARLASTLKRG